MTKFFKSTTKLFHKIPVVGKIIKETARAADHIVSVPQKAVHQVVNKLSGRDKIKKIALQQKEQQTQTINEAKRRSLAEVVESYQQCLASIEREHRDVTEERDKLIEDKEEIINYVNAAKTALLAGDQNILQEDLNPLIQLLDQQATDIIDQYVIEIQQLDRDIANVRQIQVDFLAQQGQTSDRLEVVQQELQNSLNDFSLKIEEHYERLLQQNQEELHLVIEQENYITSQYFKQTADIEKQYDAFLQQSLHQVDVWKKKAARKTTRNFALQIASSLVSNCIAPGISASLNVSSKLGLAAIKSATFSTIDSIVSGQIKQMPKKILKNTATSLVHPIVGTNIVEPLNISDVAICSGISRAVSSGVIAAVSGENIFKNMVVDGTLAYVGQRQEELEANSIVEPISAQQEIKETKASNNRTDNQVVINKENIPQIENSSSALFDFDRVELLKPSIDELFPTKPPFSASRLSIKDETSSSIKIMETNHEFHPAIGVQGNAFNFEDHNVSRCGVFSQSLEDIHTKAFDVVRWKKEEVSVGITPFFESKNTIVAAAPGAFPFKSIAETQAAIGINVAQIIQKKVKVDVDLFRLDGRIGTEMSTSITPSQLVANSSSILSYAEASASLVSVTTAVGPVKVPFTNIECTSTAKIGFLNYNSENVVPISTTTVSIATVCSKQSSIDQSITTINPPKGPNLQQRAVLRP